MSCGKGNAVAAIMPPSTRPPTNQRFHASFFQSYRKKGIFGRNTAAQTCENEDEMPNDLFPISSNNGTVSPISGPETYQGQGCDNVSIICFIPKPSNPANTCLTNR